MSVGRAIIGVLWLLCAVLAAAIQAPGPANVSYAELERFRKEGVPDERWPALMETLGTDEQRVSIREFIRSMKPFPGQKLVTLLSHPRLAPRLGALEMLEDAAGETFDFDPWHEPTVEGSNREALKLWQKWAEKGEVKSGDSATTLTDETFRVLALEITGNNADRAERSLRRLEGFGLSALPVVERFLQSHPDLEGHPRAMLKQAQYRIVLAQTLPKEAAGFARELALGLPEAQSTALGRLNSGGPVVLAVLAEFLVSEDPLVRETAMDAAFAAGERDAVPLVLEQLKKEQTENVLHAALRGLGKLVKSSDEAAAIIKLLEHPSENVVIAAIEALGLHTVGSPGPALTKCLGDSRWRVRAAALETLGKRGITAATGEVKKCFADPEVFARVTAVTAYAQLTGVTSGGSDSEGVKFLIEVFEKQHELKAAILSVFFNSQNGPPPRLWDTLQSAPPEVILQCLETLESRDDHNHKRVVHAERFAAHPNKDVAAAAARILATHGRSTALLLKTLQSKDEAQVDSVLDALRLKPTFFGRAPVASSGPPNSVLDQLYARIATAGEGSAVAATPPDVSGSADPTVFAETLRKRLHEGSPRQQLRSALVLFPSGDEAAREYILKVFESLAPVDRRAVAGGLCGLADWSPVMDLAKRVLRDPADDVRETAIESWMANPSRIAALLAEATRPGSLIGPAEIYDWQFDRMIESGAAVGAISEWAGRVLGDPHARDAHKAFAIVLADRAGLAKQLGVEKFTIGETAALRRAAWRAMGLSHAEAHLDEILDDPSALVRQVLPFLASPSNNTWQHYFDDASYVADHQDFQPFRSTPKFGAWAGGAGDSSAPSDALLGALEKLTRDPSDSVRFEAMFALLRLEKPVDPRAMAAVVARQPSDSMARYRLGNYLEMNYARLGQGYGLLVPLADSISDDNLVKMRAHFKLEKSATPTSLSKLAALAQMLPKVSPATENQIAPRPPKESANAAGPFRVILFFKQGCRECERARQMLAEHSRNFPNARIEERDIDVPVEAVLNEALSSRFQVKDTLHQVTPAIFTQTGALVKDGITFPALGDLLRSAQDAPRVDGWDRVEVKEVAAAEGKIEDRYDALSLGVVGLAGLLDGINPCAFATIIFLLSYLQVARRSPGEILAVGAAFVSAVFLAYFFVGLGLIQVLGHLDGMRSIGNVLNYALAAFALILALFSFRDAQLASRGELAEMTLQLPSSLKNQIRTTIRASSKTRRFVIGAFLAGLAISLLELACTGQVYLPTILYMVRAGRGEAIGHLVAYNLAFILPLIVVFLLAWAGMRSDALLRFQQKHVVLVKVMTGVLFLGLTAFLLFGNSIMPMVAASGR